MRRTLLAALIALGAGPAAAESWRATYTITAAGVAVLEAVVRMELNPSGYSVETEVRTRGIAATLVSGQQTTRAEGEWGPDGPRPRRYITQGSWRGQPRRVEMSYAAGQPRILAIEPPNHTERHPVPTDQTFGAVDSLSAMAWLVREAQRTGSCAGEKRIYDARQLTHFVSRTTGNENLADGVALRCAMESRTLAGFRLDRDPAEAARPQMITAWIAAPMPDAPPVPVRIELASRWWGRLQAELTGFRRVT